MKTENNLMFLVVFLIFGLLIAAAMIYYNVEESRPYIVITIVISGYATGFMHGSRSTRAIHKEGAELGTLRAKVEGESVKHVAQLGGQMLKHSDQVHRHYQDQVPAPNGNGNDNFFVIPANVTVEE